MKPFDKPNEEVLNAYKIRTLADLNRYIATGDVAPKAEQRPAANGPNERKTNGSR